MTNARRSLTFTLFVLVLCSAAAFGIPAILNSRTLLPNPIHEFLGVAPDPVLANIPAIRAFVALRSDDSLTQADATAILFSGSTGAAWLSTSSWTGGVVPTSTQIAQFGANPIGTTPSVGISFSTTTNAGTQVNGQRVEEVGAVSTASTRTNNLTIGNSANIAGASGALRPLGVTVNAQDNVIIRHAGSGILTIQNTQGSGNQTMALELINPTESIINVDGVGTVSVLSAITGVGKNLTIGGTGNGSANTAITTLFAANTYSGNTKVTGNGVLTLAGTGSIAQSPSIEIGGGAGLDVQSLTTAMVLSSGQALKASGTTSTGTIFTSSSKGLTTAADSPLIFSAFNGTKPPLAVSNTNGKLTLQSGNIVTVTVANGGTPLGIGDYKLIAKINSATGVVGAPSSVTVNGDGLASGTIASLINISGELFLHVVVDTTAATDFFRSKQTGNWSALSTWESSHDGTTWISATAVPDVNANTIAIRNGHTVTVNVSTTADQLDIQAGGVLVAPGGNLNVNDGTGDDVTVENGGLLEAGAGSFVNGGQVQVNGTFQLDEGASALSGTFAYDQSDGTLKFNNTTVYNIGINDAFWPLTNGPQNVAVVGSGGIHLFGPRTLNGTVSYAAGIDGAQNLTLNGVVVVQNGGFIVSGSPTYGAGSELDYSIGTTYGRNGEWLPGATSGAGYPSSVVIESGTTLDLANGSPNSAFQIAAVLDIQPGGALIMTGSGGMTQPLKVLRNFTVSGSMTLSNKPGGDLFVGGNFFSFNGGLVTNGRRVTLNGTTDQIVFASNTFDALSIVTTTARTVQFEGGSTQTVNSDLVLTGTAGNLLSLRSTTEGTQWKLHAPIQSSQNVHFVDVEDSDASGFPEVFALNSVNSGNNINWRFAQPGSVQFSTATYSANENDGSVTITATRTGGSDGPISIAFADDTGTATPGSGACAAGDDYLKAGVGATFNWGDGDSADQSFPLPLCDDASVESDETVDLVLSGPTGGATLGTNSSAVLTIHDDDAATPPALASFTATPPSGSEADQTAITLTATLDSAPAADTTVNVSVDTGSGVTTGDYTLSSATITVAAGETSGTAVFTVKDDSEYEGPEIAHLHAALGSVTKDLNIQIDDNDPSPTTLVVTNTTDADGVCLPGNCSLRQAINSADESADVSTITFNIPGAGVHTIMPTSEFSPLVFPTIIDGYTQPGASANTLATGSDAVILIEVDGANVPGPFSNGITTAAQLTVKGLALNDYGFGINIQGGTGTVIAGNFLGTDAAGTTFKGNTVASVTIAAGSNIIGGSTAASRNLLISNGFAVQVSGANGNTISNNYIGLNAAGDTSIPSGGIILQSASGNQIGGTTAAERNVIVSAGDGIVVAGNTNVVEGNFIGTDASGANGLFNLGSGVKLLGDSTGNTIGGTATGAGNVIASCGIINSQDAGVNFVGDTVNGLFPSGNTVAGNLIGTNAAGTAALGNNRGIDLTNAPNNTIGGTTSAARNVISGNLLGNIRLQGTHATGNIIEGNFIGTDITGSLPLSISTNNILITSTAANNVIGGTASGAGNVIAFSTSGAGVRVDDFGGAGNSVVGNSIFSNTGGGIDIGAGGPTANDALDGDTGAGGDDIQNFPVITSVTGSGSNATISGTLNSTPGQTFSIDVYASAMCDTSGFGQGKVYLGRQSTGSTDGSGDTTFNLLSAVIPAGMNVITATATNSNGSTSEFSQCFDIPAGTVQFSSATYSVGESGPTATITVTRAGGFAGAASVDFATSPGTATDGAACTAGVDFVSNSGTLNWADGDASAKTFDVSICDDAVFEGDESVNLGLSNATGAGGGGVTSAVLTITDNDSAASTVQFSSATYKGAEGTNVAVTVMRSSSVGASSVDFATSGLTPTTGPCSIGSGSDYISRSETIDFADGESEKTVDITLCSDLLIENPAESIDLTLSNPTGATLGSQLSASLTILDVANEFFSNAKIDLTNGVQPVVNYPSPIDVEGVPGGVNGVRLSLTNVTALDAHNIEVLLVSPDNRTFRAMAAVGGNFALTGATITLEDSAPTRLPQSAAITDGQNYKPANCTDNSFKLPDPAPALPYGDPGCASVIDTFASVFGGVDPNGTWKLYVFEHQGQDRPTTRNGVNPATDGSIGGWGLQFLAPTAAPASVGGRVLTAYGQGIRNTRVTISGGDLAAPKTMYTADFGYYYFSGLTAGQTYVISVEPRRYVISHPTRVVSLLDSIADLDFVADP